MTQIDFDGGTPNGYSLTSKRECVIFAPITPALDPGVTIVMPPNA